MVEDIEAHGASIHSREVTVILCLAQIVFQIQITLKNVIEIQNTVFRYFLQVEIISLASKRDLDVETLYMPLVISSINL